MIEGIRYAWTVLRRYQARDLAGDLLAMVCLAGFWAILLYVAPFVTP